MVLVTGGAGYIGSHCVRMLLNAGEEVAVIDNLSTGHAAAIAQDAHFFEGDIRDRDFLIETLQKTKADAIIHFAASSLVGESMINPLKYFDNNVNGTCILLSAMAQVGVKKIVFSSSAAVYGDVFEELITENTPTVPESAYGESKLMIEKMMRWCKGAYGIDYISLRYFNVAGADRAGDIGEDHNPETHLIPIVLGVALGKRERLDIYGDDYPTQDGTCIRDYIHVSDLCDAHKKALERLRANKGSDIFNLGTSEGYSVLEIYNAAKEVTGRDIPVRIAPRRPGDPARLVAGAQRAKELLGWMPLTTDVREIVEDAWRWHLSHPKGYGEL